MPDDGFSPNNAELAMCAQMNFQTVAALAPALAAHPIFRMAQEQLDALVKRLDAD
jgi:hypothetical protein